MSVYYKERPEWLKMSINSMLDQTIKADEFLIIKDGPLTDELDKVLDEYKIQYPELFNIIALDNNVGLGPALSCGIRLCRNELVARMDSDDYSDPQRCEKQLSVLQNDPTLDVVGCFENEFEDNIDNVMSIHTVPTTNEEINYYMRRRCALLHPTVIYKRSAVLSCGNYHNLYLYEDYDLFFRMVQNGARCFNIQEGLYYMRINENFFKRRGGWSYMKTVMNFKFKQYKKGYMSWKDYAISAGSQSVVCLLPNKLRKWVYLKILR
jgi:glycosyltransferase involved in cell wall biosynthesis